jgi:3-hydroxyisobutyrate dehydrogenase
MHVGDVGAGHVVKALNNLLSATHLLATSEAMAAAASFGLDAPAVLEAINSSTGRSWSSEYKWPTFVVPWTFDFVFSLRLMVKDMRIALGLASSAGTPARLSAAATGLWPKRPTASQTTPTTPRSPAGSTGMVPAVTREDQPGPHRAHPARSARSGRRERPA